MPPVQEDLPQFAPLAARKTFLKRKSQRVPSQKVDFSAVSQALVKSPSRLLAGEAQDAITSGERVLPQAIQEQASCFHT